MKGCENTKLYRAAPNALLTQHLTELSHTGDVIIVGPQRKHTHKRSNEILLLITIRLKRISSVGGSAKKMLRASVIEEGGLV